MTDKTTKKLIEWGWIDGQGRSLTWLYWFNYWQKADRQ